MKILLVDESNFFLAIEAQMLKNVPCELLQARSVAEMLELVRAQRPELIYLAVGLSEVSGIEGCRQLKADPQLRSVPVVLICDSESTEQTAAAKDAGGDAVLTKPLDRQSFLSVGSRFVDIIREPRRACLFAVGYRWEKLDLTGKCLDLSSGGLFLQGPEPVAEGDELALSFTLPDGDEKPIRCCGRVTWINEREDPMKPHYPHGFGVKFETIEAGDVKRITAFLEG